jgi:hypothetical protein
MWPLGGQDAGQWNQHIDTRKGLWHQDGIRKSQELILCESGHEKFRTTLPYLVLQDRRPRELLSFGTIQWPSEDEIWELLYQLQAGKDQ